MEGKTFSQVHIGNALRGHSQSKLSLLIHTVHACMYPFFFFENSHIPFVQIDSALHYRDGSVPSISGQCFKA